MGFWKFVGGVVKTLGNDLLKEVQNMPQLKSQYAEYSDSRLVSIARGEGIFGNKLSEKTAAFAVLKDRYGEEGARERISNG